MKLLKILLITATAFGAFSSAPLAHDFGWSHVFDFEAYSDPLLLRTRLASRFNIDDTELNVILSTSDSPADAYIILRLGEISGRPINYVVERYSHKKDTGWNAVALSLGIEPESEEFYALKREHDLHIVDNLYQIVDASSDSEPSK